MKTVYALKLESLACLVLGIVFYFLGCSEICVSMFFVFSFVSATAAQVVEYISGEVEEE